MTTKSIIHQEIESAVTAALHRVGISAELSGSPIPPAALFDSWLSAEREKTPVDRYQRDAHALFKRFVAFLEAKKPELTDLRFVTKQDARDFLKTESARGISAKTFNNHLILLRSAFTEVMSDCGIKNPFAGLRRKQPNMIGRDCFSDLELELILKEADKDSFIGPVVTLAALTAMRRGDCCLLQQKAVDLERRMIRVKTRKTGRLVWVPMFARLHTALKKALAGRPLDEEGFVFPEVAAMYLENPDGISWRFKMLLRHARVMGDDDLATVEDTGPRVRRPSRRGFHAFRTTWVTLALNHGVSESLVLDITGIRTVQVVRTNYFRPRAEEYESALAAKLPSILKSGSVGPKATPRADAA